jgi:hypothetical protein
VLPYSDISSKSLSIFLVSNVCKPTFQHSTKIAWKDRIISQFNQEWNSMKSSPPTSIKGRVYKGANDLKSRIDPHELFMIDISDHIRTSNLEILYPSSESVDMLKSDISNTIVQLRARNKWKLIGYSLVLPFTLVFSVLPTPNIILAANLVRLYSLWLTKNSLIHLSDLMLTNTNNPPSITYIPISGKGMNWKSYMETENSPTSTSVITSQSIQEAFQDITDYVQHADTSTTSIEKAEYQSIDNIENNIVAFIRFHDSTAWIRNLNYFLFSVKE